MKLRSADRGRARSFPPLRRRLFVATVAIVIASIGVAFGVGVVLTRNAVESANIDGLNRQAELIKSQEESAILPFSAARLSKLRSFLAKQHEQIHVFDLKAPPAYLPPTQVVDLLGTKAAKGSVTVDGKRYFDAAVGNIKDRPGKGFILLRPASLKAAGWGPFLRALVIAGAIGAALAALGSLIIARWIAGPVRRVADASRSLAEGISPDPVPLGGSAELAMLAQTFNAMARQLNQAREAERNFLLSVSHELKTPLAAIRGYAEGLEDGIFTTGESTEIIRVEARRLERLVRDLLDLARMNRTDFSVHLGEIDLAEVADDAVRRYEQQAAAFGVGLTVDSGASAPAFGDADRVLQVVSNLLENALRLAPPGGEVRVVARPGLVRVEDTGPGLRPEEREHAFERFYLHERYGRERPVGTGLGLAIVKELTEAMGGSVEVTSEPGRLTTFAVRLAVPAREPAPAA